MSEQVESVSSERGPDPRWWTFLGIALIAGGAVLLAVAWGLVAGQDQVALQVPYLLSAGLPGAGLIVVGVGAVVLGVRESDSRARRSQQRELLGLLTALRDELTR